KAFGETVQVVGSDRNPHQYGGQWGYYSEESPASSRLYVRMRHLRVDQGRWGSRDPLVTVDDWNLYRYVWNSPTGFADPAGFVALPVPDRTADGGGQGFRPPNPNRGGRIIRLDPSKFRAAKPGLGPRLLAGLQAGLDFLGTAAGTAAIGVGLFVVAS